MKRLLLALAFACSIFGAEPSVNNSRLQNKIGGSDLDTPRYRYKWIGTSRNLGRFGPISVNDIVLLTEKEAIIASTDANWTAIDYVSTPVADVATGGSGSSTTTITNNQIVHTPIQLGTGTAFSLDPLYKVYLGTASGNFTITLATNSVDTTKVYDIEFALVDSVGSRTGTLSSGGTGGASFASPAMEGNTLTNSPTPGTNTYLLHYDGVWHLSQNTAQIPLSQLGNGATTSGTLLTDTSTATVTGKLIDASASGNVLKFKQYLPLSRPDFGDGIGAVPQTNDYTAVTFMHYKFSGSAATNANYVVYLVSVPTDIDTSAALRARLKVRLSATETAASTFNLGVIDVADSASGAVGSAGNWVAVAISADASGAANDLETSAWITLTGWAAALTADHMMFIVLNRDGNDAATSGIYDAELKIEYGATQ